MHIVVYSGGMDSFTLLHSVCRHAAQTSRESVVEREVIALSFDYGQRHAKELHYAGRECSRLGIRHEVIDLAMIKRLLTGSALTDASVKLPEGHYAEEQMRKTVVPGRNTFMLALAMAFAEAQEGPSHTVWYGAHAGDHHIYPDCRPGFANAMSLVYEQATEGRVNLQAPFLYADKAGILQHGSMLGLSAADYARSWTCYAGEEHACGKCGSCNERLEAFAAVGWTDPHDPALRPLA